MIGTLHKLHFDEISLFFSNEEINSIINGTLKLVGKIIDCRKEKSNIIEIVLSHEKTIREKHSDELSINIGDISIKINRKIFEILQRTDTCSLYGGNKGNSKIYLYNLPRIHTRHIASGKLDLALLSLDKEKFEQRYSTPSTYLHIPFKNR